MIIKIHHITNKMATEKLDYCLHKAKNNSLPLAPKYAPYKIDNTKGQDEYCGAFHVTGDEKYIIPIVNVLEESKDSFARCLVVNPIDASLDSIELNMSFDTNIENILRDIMPTKNALAQKRIKQLLNNY
ncbi:MAG: hypothetical protein GY804_07245 [Alphaproteobacteria bacterium]|nr:hypothetical protein [Alphaproteobacteria bacterium]